MKTIFAKYNRERLPKYQIVTKIVLDNDGQRYAIKEALCDEAKAHIEDIYSNYELLKNAYNLNLVKPRKTENGVMFEMAQGQSLESLLLECIENNDIINFVKYIDAFLKLIDGMVSKRGVVFEPCERFKTIFGAWELDEPQDIIEVANIDLIFGNIFIDENEDFAIIDYEWVFDFEVPKSFIVWRSLYIFLQYHKGSVVVADFEKIIDGYGFLSKYDYYLKNDENFYRYVCGKDFDYALDYSRMKMNINPVADNQVKTQTIEQQTQTIEQQTQTIEQQTQTIEQQTQTIEQQSQTIEQQTQTIELQSQTIEQQTQTIEQQTQTIEQQTQTIEQQSQTIEQQTQTIEQQTQTIEQQTQTIEQQTQTISELAAKNISLQDEVIKYAMSRSWALTRPLRVLMRLLMGVFRGK